MNETAEPEFQITPYEKRPSGGMSGAAPVAPATPTPGGVRPPAQEEPQFSIGPDVKFERGPLGAADVAMGAATSFIPSAVEFGKSLVHPIMHPIETGQAIGALGKGLYSKAAGAFGAEQDPTQKAETEAPVEALKKHFVDRYGSVESAKRTFATDPVGFLADVSTPLTLGGSFAARAPGVIGKVGQITQKAGSVIDPVSATASAAAAIPKVTAIPAFWKSGTSFRSMSDAAKAGADLNPTFWQHMTGQGTPQDVVKAVQDGVSQIQKQASAEYLAGMDAIKAAKPLDYTNVLNTLDAQKGRAYTAGGIQKNEAAAAAIKEMDNKIAEFYFQKQHPTAHTITDFDELKKALDDIAFRYKGEPVAHGAITNVRKAVYNTIADADPRYAQIMENYSQTADLVKELSKDLLGPNSNTVATRMRKILKDQDKATKGRLLEELAKINPDIPYMIAGQELSQLFPQGIRGALTSAGAIYGAGPLGAMTVPLMSPRVGGGMQYGLGAVTGVPGQVEKRIPAPVRAGAYGAGEATRALEEERPERRAGGRIGSGIAESLMRAAEKAKRELGKETETLLNAPDEHIAKALDIAKRHI